MKPKRRFDSLRFKVYQRFCKKCPRIFPTKKSHAKVCKECSNRSWELQT